jgi:hypothetical protein
MVEIQDFPDLPERQGQVTRRMWAGLWPDKKEQDVGASG